MPFSRHKALGSSQLQAVTYIAYKAIDPTSLVEMAMQVKKTILGNWRKEYAATKYVRVKGGKTGLIV